MPTNSEPFEVIAGPIQVWTAPIATAFPAIDAAPGVGWTLLGTNGDKNITEDGLTIRHTGEDSIFYSLGSTGPRKNFRTREGQELEFVLADLSAEMYARALNLDPADIVDTAAATGTAGERYFPTLRGFTFPTVAVLARCGMSPYGDGFNSQWEVPMAQQVGNPELVFNKSDPVGLQFLFRCLEDPVNGFGGVRFQDAVALP